MIRGLDQAADEYLVKPVSLLKLMAHVRALLRRVALPPPSPQTLRYDDGYLTLDLIKQQVLVREQRVELTNKEYELLIYLYQHADQLRPHQQILRDV